MDLAAKIRDVPDFPKPGVLFKDITTLLKDPAAFRHSIDALTEPFRNDAIDVVVGLEARGFIFSAPVAYLLGAGFVPIRKVGRLPHTKTAIEYELEYGTAAFEVHLDAIEPGQRVLLVDDVLATGGTTGAAVQLIERLGGTVVGCGYLAELTFLNGRAVIEGRRVHTLLQYA